jgi:long-chain fatty acid transport protein
MMRRSLTKSGKAVIPALISACITAGMPSGPAHAGAAYIYEMGNPTDVGYASAGLAVRAGDAGTVFTNPAGMTRFESPEMVAAGTALYIYGPYNSDENTTVTGSDGQTSELFGSGSFAYIRPVSDRLKLGISAQNFFGLALDWSDSWVGRYTSVKAVVIAPQLQPTVAYKVNDWLSIGAGAALTLGYLSDKARIEPVLPGRADGKLRYSDSDFAVQGNIGIMIEPSDNTRIGLRYLTETDLDFKDGANISGVGSLPDLDPDSDLANPRNGLDLGMKMPQSVMAGVYHRVDDRWTLLGSVGWDEWSSFGRAQVVVEGTNINTVVNDGFRDTWHFGAAAEYQYSPKWKLTGGVSYDTSMASDATRPLVLPLGSMTRYGLGFEFKKREDLTLGGGLTFLWEGNLPTKPTGGVSGKYENVSITFLSFYARWH